MKMKNIILFSFIFFLMSCYDDKGNYDYREMAEIRIENLPETLEILGGIEHIVAQPKVTSSLEGEIKDGNPNFEFSYRLENRERKLAEAEPKEFLERRKERANKK